MTRSTMTQSRRTAAILGLAALALAACKAKEEEGGSHPMVNATTGVVAAGPFRETVGAIGTVVPRVGSVALLSAPAPTRVANVRAVVGQPVKKGAVLVEFERAPFDARLASAEAAERAADQAYQRAKSLVGQGIAARKDEEQAAADLARARADRIAARRDAELAQLASPIDGIVTKMTAVLGASVDASQPVVEVADPRSFDVVLTVAPDVAARIHAGAAVTLMSAQGADGEPLGTGQVREVGGAVDPETRGVAIRVAGSALKRALRIGESVAASVVVAEYAKAVLVPAKALVPKGEAFTVFTVDEDGVAHELVVTVGGRSGAMVRIAGGLKAGQIIVVDGAFGMTDGGKIANISDEDDDEPGAEPAAGKADTAKKPDAAKKP